MLVFYFLQGELGESMDCPNAFVVPGNSLTFGEFLQHFPMLDKASMHFRFQSEDPSHGFVWEDIREASRTLPVYQGNIFAKILRIGNDAAEKRKFILKRKNFDPSNPIIKAIQSQSSRPTATARSASGARQTTDQEKAPSAPPKPSKPLPKSPANAPPASVSDTATPPPAPAAPQASAPNFFDDGETSTPTYAPPPDILGGFDDPPTTSSAKLKPSSSSSRSPVNVSASAMDIDDDHRPGRSSSSVTAGGDLNRAELAARKEEAIEDKVRSALEFKKEVDQKKEREQLEFDSAKAKYEQALNSWASNNKEKRNVRTLISTMHTVLPSDSKWKPLGLGDVLEPSQVKKAYRKAMLVVHPDHCINLDSEHKFICKRVFEALNEAYEEFAKKENV